MNKVIAIVGLSKNAGKTSYLNWCVKKLHSQPSKIALTTTGRDGEDIDLVTGDKKPKVILPPDAIFTSFEHIFDTQSTQIKALEKLPFRVIGKRLWLYQTLSNIEAEVVGPATVKEQESLIAIFSKYHCTHIFIDGSIDRKSICLSPAITEVALVVGASAGDMETIKRQAHLLKLYSQIRKNLSMDGDSIKYSVNGSITETDINTVYGNESEIADILSQKDGDWLYFPFVITDISYQKLKHCLLNYSGEIIFRHPFLINIPLKDLECLLATKKVSSLVSFPLKTVVVNSYSTNNAHIDAELLKREMQSLFPDIPVIDITDNYSISS